MYLVVTVTTFFYLLPIWCLGVGSTHAEKEPNSNNTSIAVNSTVIALTNDTSKQKNSTDPQPHVAKDQTGDSDPEENKIAANIAITVITVVIILMILVMSVYFIRKFQQLSRSTPSYRYSSLKTEINGIDDKAETQALVSVSTDEDDYDDEMQSPPTLRVQSQTVMTNSVIVNGPIVASPLSTTSTMSGAQTETDEIVALDSDDEFSKDDDYKLLKDVRLCINMYKQNQHISAEKSCYNKGV